MDASQVVGILQIIVAVGLSGITGALFQRHFAKKKAATQLAEGVLVELRDEIASMRQGLSKLDGIEERLAEVTLQLHDIAKRALPPDAAFGNEPGSKPRHDNE